MNHYLDIEVLPDPEFPPHQLMDALYAKLHRALVHLGTTDIAVSFPRVDESIPTLGKLLRLHGSEAVLAQLMGEPWLVGMRDHIQVKGVAEVPSGTSHRQVRRVQSKSSPERIRRRQMRRHGWTEEEAMARIPETAGKKLRLPFVSLGSRSTGHKFHLFIEHLPVTTPVNGSFNAYGLSSEATIPWF